MNQVQHFIDGGFTNGVGERVLKATNPVDGKVIAQLNSAQPLEVEFAIASAQKAFMRWKEVPVSERARVMLKYQHLLKENLHELTELVALETGKITADARGDVWRGIEVVEHACNVPSLMMGETLGNVVSGINMYSYRQPLGVCAGITPFNFPAMIPLWMFPIAIACGNTFVLKPSEQNPLTPTRLVEIFQQAGAPEGVLQLVHGDAEAADVLLRSPDVQAISFVGSMQGAKSVYLKASENFKRVQACSGAKNHAVICPDANKKKVIDYLVSASIGAAGQRCMALSAAVFVGESKAWIPDLVKAFKSVRPGSPSDLKADFGPLVSKQAKERVKNIVAAGIHEGATCLVDGSELRLKDYPKGNWVGATLFDDVTTDMALYQEEIFGPVLSCLHVDSLDQAISLVNENPFGNGTAIFTESGASARQYQQEIMVGQVGINVPIPVPLPYFSFTGWKNSFFGDQHTYGKQAVHFYTETKTITSRWLDKASQKNMSISL